MLEQLQRLMQDPAILASLQHTLTPAGLLSQSDADSDRVAAELAARAKAASEAAATAGQQYQTAAAATPPQLDPLAAALPQLLGNISSVIGQDKSYSQRAHENVRGAQDDLVRARLDNLAALKDTFDKKAAAAENAGNLEISEKSRAQSEKLAKTMQVLLQQKSADEDAARLKQGHEYRMQEIAATGAQARQTQDNKPDKATPDIAKITYTTASGKRFVKLGALTGDAKNSVISRAAEAGLPALEQGDAQAVQDVDRARRDIRKLETEVLKIAPRDPQGRIVLAGNRRLSEVLQTSPQRAAFRTWRDAAIPILRAMAGSKGLRITQQQVELAVKNLPTQNDTWETVREKVGIINKLLDNAEGPILETDWTPQAIADSTGDESAPFRRRGR